MPAQHDTAASASVIVPQATTIREVLTVEEAAKGFLADLRRRVDAGVVKLSHYRSQSYRLDTGIVPIKDLSLPRVGQEELRTAVLRLVQRPMVAKPAGFEQNANGKRVKRPPKLVRMSHSYATNSLNTLRWFFEWADKWDLWHNNRKFFDDVFNVAPILTDEERRDQLREASGADPEQFTVPQLVKLWQVCPSDRMRLLMLLGLNCGFANMELATLKKWECKLDLTRPFIERLRQKTQRNGVVGVYAKWMLWPETVTLLKREMNADEGETLVLLTAKGRPLVEETEKYGRKDAVIQAWRRLLEKASMKGGLSPKYLRKTSASMVRKASGSAELADMLLSHSDGIKIKKYTPRDWDRLGEVLAEVRVKLQPLFDAHAVV